MKKFLIFWFLSFLTVSIGLLQAADLISVLPITNKILAVHFDEGHIDYWGVGQDRYDGNKVYYSKLILNNAAKAMNYSVISEDDANFSEAQTPVHIGRKSKGVDFNNIYDSGEPEVIKHHWLYIELPYEMQTGKTYTVLLNDLAANTDEYTFVFDPVSVRSPSIHVNQIGFVPSAPKYAYVSHFMGSFNTTDHDNGGLNLPDASSMAFHVVRVADDSVMFSGTLAKQRDKSDQDFWRTDKDFMNQNFTLAHVYECDFSGFTLQGEYKIVVENMGCSYPFEIANDIYRQAYYHTSRAMFVQRSGVVKEIEPGLEFQRDHHPDDGIVFRYFPNEGGDHSTPDPATAEGEVTGIWGWYHDASDWDCYGHHYRVPFGLLALYDLKPENFGDGDVNNKYKLSDADSWIMEGENGIPDLLDEAMWLINFYKRAKYALIDQGYSDGGVPGYVGVDAGADGNSWEDTRDLAVKGGEMTTMTYRYAAGAAWLATCLDKSLGSVHTESPGWIEEAEAAYAWAEAKNEDDDEDANRAKMIAAAALYRYTADSTYQEDFRTAKTNDNSWKSKLWFNYNPWHFASLNFAMIPDNHPGLDLDLKQSVVNDIIAQADFETVDPANDRGFRYGADKDILFMLGSLNAPKTYLAAIAYELTGEQKYLDACYTTCDYCLGGNQMDLVKVTGLGENLETQLFHAASWYNFDLNSKVYTNPIIEGFLAYEMYRKGDGNWNWIGDDDYGKSTAYPEYDNFPAGEARFPNRSCVIESEFTVHQTQVQAIFGYGYLCDDFSGSYTPNTRPAVAINLDEGVNLPQDTTVILTASGSTDLRRVEYYYDWHFIGESTDKENDFAFAWHLSKYKIDKGNQVITAKGFDDQGKISRPEDAGDVTVRIVDASSTDVPEKTGFDFQYELKQNYPNPFNPKTVIGYHLSEKSDVQLDVYNASGQHVSNLISGRQSAGSHQIQFDGSGLPSGIYVYQLETEDYLEKKKMLLLK